MAFQTAPNKNVARTILCASLIVSLLVVFLTDRAFSWLSYVGSQAAFPWRGLLLQVLYVGSPWVMLGIAFFAWIRFQRVSLAWLLIVIPGLVFFTQWLTAPWTDWPDNFITPVVATCWCVAGNQVTTKRFGWLVLLMLLVIVASLSVQAIAWEWVGIQFLLGLFLGGLVEWPYRLLFFAKPSGQGFFTRRKASSNPTGTTWAEPVW